MDQMYIIMDQKRLQNSTNFVLILQLGKNSALTGHFMSCSRLNIIIE